MDMTIGSAVGNPDIADSAGIPLVWYEAEERQLDCVVRNGSDAGGHPYLTTVINMATGKAVTSQLSSRPMDRERLRELAWTFGGVFLPLGEPDRWAIALPQICEVL